MGRIPIVGWGARELDSGDQDAGVDDVLPKPCSAEALIQACEKWRPEQLPPAFVKLQEAFGTAAALDLLDRFRQLLIEVLGSLATGRPRDLAHRVAGMAGMLGFTALGQQWLGLSEGEDTDLEALRYATRRAIVTIDLKLPSEP